MLAVSAVPLPCLACHPITTTSPPLSCIAGLVGVKIAGLEGVEYEGLLVNAH